MPLQKGETRTAQHTTAQHSPITAQHITQHTTPLLQSDISVHILTTSPTSLLQAQAAGMQVCPVLCTAWTRQQQIISGGVDGSYVCGTCKREN